jgi:hypothetical protein
MCVLITAQGQGSLQKCFTLGTVHIFPFTQHDKPQTCHILTLQTFCSRILRQHFVDILIPWHWKTFLIKLLRLGLHCSACCCHFLSGLSSGNGAGWLFLAGCFSQAAGWAGCLSWKAGLAGCFGAAGSADCKLNSKSMKSHYYFKCVGGTDSKLNEKS